MLDAIGHTPVVRLNKVMPAGAADVYVKLEWFNPTGSYKDRMALAMIVEAERRGDLTPGMTVVEYTGGSTGSSLAYVCAVKGYRFRVVSSDAFRRREAQDDAGLWRRAHDRPQRRRQGDAGADTGHGRPGRPSLPPSRGPTGPIS
jgi:hypothetical protein